VGWFNRSTNSSSTTSPTRRPILDPDSDACAWLDAADASDPATVDRALAAVRAELDAMEANLARLAREID
jgi:hypothetical protein